MSAVAPSTGLRTDLAVGVEEVPPGPRWPAFLQGLAWYVRPLRLLEWSQKRFGDTFTIDLRPFGRFVFVSHPEQVKEVFRAPPDVLHAGEMNQILAPVLGVHSVLTSDGARHMRQRKLLLPPFHGERMEVYRDRMRAAARRDIDEWPRGEPFKLADRTVRITGDVIVELVFGVDDAGQRARFMHALPELAAIATPVMFMPALEKVAWPGTPAWRLARARARVDELVHGQIAERRAAPDLAERTDVLSMLVQARDEDGNEMPDAELRDELMTLMIAGHETTASTLAWAVDLLLRHPEALSRLRDELATGDETYLDAVVKEVHRMRPVVPNVVRRVKKPFTLGDRVLPPGAVVSVAAHLVQRRPDLYPDPNRFRPERFLDAKTETYGWLPFGGGIRRCIGAAFATLELKVILRELIAQDLRLADPTRPERPKRRTVTSVPDRGTRVVLAA